MHSLSLPQLVLALALAAGAGVKVEDDFAGATHDGLAPAKATPTVKASSVLCEGKGAKQQCFPPASVLDEDAATAWCEGAAGDGVGQALTFSFPAKVTLGAVALLPYYGKSAATARNNARVAQLEVRLDGKAFTATLPDVAHRERCVRGPCGDETCDEAVGGDEVCFDAKQRVEDGEGLLLRFPPAAAQTVTLTVRGVHPGEKYEDLCVSSVAFYAPD